MRVRALAVLACMGCAAAPSTKPSTVPAPAADLEPSAERRPYAEVARIPLVTAEDSPGVWVQFGAIGQLDSRLPEAAREQADVGGMAAALGESFGEDVAGVIDLDQPMDLVSAPPVSPYASPQQVMSFRLRSPEAVARGQVGLTLRREAPGTWRIGNPPPPVPVEEEPADWQEGEEETDAAEEAEPDVEPEPASPTSPCVLIHAAEPVGYRVICGSDDALVHRFAPFLLRPTPATSSDVHVELGGAAYRRALAHGVAALTADSSDPDAPMGKKLGRDMLEAVVRSLGAHERVVFDVRFGPRGAEVGLDIAFGSSAGTELLRSWSSMATQNALPPSFALLPADSGVAFGFSGLGKAMTEVALARVLGDFARDMADQYALSAQDQRELSEAIARVLPDDARFSFALGGDRAGLERVLSSDAVLGPDNDEPAGSLSAGAVKSLATAFGHWIVIGVEASPQRYLPAIERLLRLRAKWPQRRPQTAPKDPERTQTKTTRRPVSVQGLPKETIHVVDDVRPSKGYVHMLHGLEPAALPHERHWLFVPDGARTWIVVAPSEQLAGARSLELLNGSQRLGVRDDVKHALERPLLAALWFSLAGWSLQQQDWESPRQRARARQRLELLAGAANGAASPVLMTLEQNSSSEGGFELRVRSTLHPAAVTDVLTWKSIPTLPGFD